MEVSLKADNKISKAGSSLTPLILKTLGFGHVVSAGCGWFHKVVLHSLLDIDLADFGFAIFAIH